MHYWSDAQIQPPDFTPSLRPCGLQLVHPLTITLSVNCFGRVKPPEGIWLGVSFALHALVNR